MTAVSWVLCRKGQKGFSDGIFHTARRKQGQRAGSPREALSPLASGPCPPRAATLHPTLPTAITAILQTHSAMCELSYGKIAGRGCSPAEEGAPKHDPLHTSLDTPKPPQMGKETGNALHPRPPPRPLAVAMPLLPLLAGHCPP